jgi:hypothetical protein
VYELSIEASKYCLNSFLEVGVAWALRRSRSTYVTPVEELQTSLTEIPLAGKRV